METYYLVDYENVGIDGLSGCNKLSNNDHIIIFFTKNAKKIDMSEIANHGAAELDMIEVPAGKQSADIHIGSYMGYLAGVNKGKDCSIIIISKDSDFDNVVKFCKEQTGVKSSRSQQIKALAAKAATAKQTQTKKKKKMADSNKKSMLNQEVMKAVRAAGLKANIGNEVAQLATSLYGKETMLIEIHNALRKKYPNYSEIYAAIKSVLSKYAYDSGAGSSAPIDIAASHAKIMQLMSKAGFESEISNFVASTVVRNAAEKNRKQQIYMTIISKYGQKKGVKIYNHIKKHI